MKRRTVLLSLILAATLSHCANAAETVELAAEDDAAPWSQKDGTGYANEVVVAAFKAVGVEAKLLVMPYARCKHLVVEGEIAGCFSMSKVPELADTVAFADKPLFVCYSDYFQNVNKPVVVKGATELPRGTRVGTVEGYEYPASVYALKDKGVIVFENCTSEELNLKKLADNRLDLALINYNETKPAEFLLASIAASGKLAPALRSGTLDSFLGFSRKHKQGLWALEKFNAGMKRISEDGTLKAIEAKWIDLARQNIAKVEKKPATPPSPEPTESRKDAKP